MIVFYYTLYKATFCLACQNPHSLKHGNFSITTAVYESMYLSGTIVEYVCDNGFVIYPQEDNIISCDSAGEWNGKIGKCF